MYFDNGLQIILARLFFRSTSILTFRKKSWEFVVDYGSNDHNGFLDCLLKPMYSRLLVEINIPRQKLSYLDLGASVGGFTFLLHQLGFTFLKSVSCEMHPSTFRRLAFNLTRNIDGGFLVLNAAVGGTDQPRHVAMKSEGSSASLYTEPDGQEVSVSGITISSIVEKSKREFGSDRFDLAKIDIEGAEHEILDTEIVLLARHVKFLIIEVHPNDRRVVDKFSERLRVLGFVEQLRGVVPDDNVCAFRSIHY